jgi:hypothetical protein
VDLADALERLPAVHRPRNVLPEPRQPRFVLNRRMLEFFPYLLLAVRSRKGVSILAHWAGSLAA